MATGTDRDLLSGPNRCVSSPLFRQEISGPLSLVGNSNADVFATKISEHDDEYKDLFKTVTKDLEKAGQKLIQIEQISNRLQKSSFQMEIDRLKSSKPSKDFQLNIRSLYHGTTAPVEQICYEGLDERLSRKGRFGKGIYFSDNPEKCCKYAARTDGLCFLLRCRVILGDIKEYPDGQHDRKNCREPLKENLNGRNIYYDSVKGKPRDHVEYVIYDKRRALIEYVIYYQSANSDSSDTPVKFDVSADKNGGAEAESGEESERCSGSATPTSTGGAGSGEESGDESDDSTSSTDQPDNTAISENKEKIFPSRNKTDAAKLPHLKQFKQTAKEKKKRTQTNSLNPNPENILQQQTRAVNHLLSIRGTVSESDMKELIADFKKTYCRSGCPVHQTIATALRRLESRTLDDPVFEVVEREAKLFSEVTGCSDMEECRGYIIHFHDANTAISAYMDAKLFKS